MGSYFFLWPLLLALVVLLLLLLTKRGLDHGSMLLVNALCLIPAIYLTVHLIYALYMALSLDLVAAYAALVILIGGALQPVISFLATPQPQRTPESRNRIRPILLKWVSPVLALLFSVVCFLIPIRSAAATRHHPNEQSDFFQDGSSCQAPGLRTSQADAGMQTTSRKGAGSLFQILFFIQDFEFPGIAAAPAQDLPGPDVSVVGDEVGVDGTRRLLLLIRTAPQEFITTLHCATPERVTAIRVNGRSMAHPTRQPSYRWPLWLESGFGRSFEVELTLNSSEPFAMEVAAMSGGLPASLLTVPRPDWSMERPFSFPDCTVVMRGYSW